MGHLLHLDCETHPLTQDEPSPFPVSLQWCVGPEPLVRRGTDPEIERELRELDRQWAATGEDHGEPLAQGGKASVGECYLVDEDPSWRWPAWSVADVIGAAPDEEATEDDDPAEAARAPRRTDLDLEPVMFDGDDMIDAFRWALTETDLLLCGTHLCFDVLVMLRAAQKRGLNLHRAVMEAYAAGRARDTGVSDKLICVAIGREEHRFSLGAMVYRYMGLDLGSDKPAAGKPQSPAAWRLRYRELERWPGDDLEAWEHAVLTGVVTRAQLERARDGRGIEPGDPRDPGTWPYHARRYALADVCLDREVWRRERDAAVRLFGRPEVPDEVSRPVFDLALYLQSTTGVTTDAAMAGAARSSLADAADRLRATLVRAGLVRRREVWCGADMVAEGDAVLCADKPGEGLRFVHRADAKGNPNPRGRSAVVEREEDDGRELVPLASLRAAVDVGRGVELSRDMAEIRRRITAAIVASGVPEEEVPLTETKLVKTDRETLDAVCGMTDDPGLRALGALSKVEKLASTYVGPLCVEGRPVRWRYDVLKDTGRTSSSALRFLAPSPEGILVSLKEGTNFQNFPGRDALHRTALALAENLGLTAGMDEAAADAWAAAWVRRHDPRRMVVARPGRLFVNVDYKAIELACMARVLNVFSKSPSSLAAVINSGKDPHLWTGVKVHPILWGGEELSYEELVRERKAAEAAQARGEEPTKLGRRVLKTRKLCKIVNFGFLGAMGAAKFVLYAWQGYGVKVELEVAKALRRAFLSTYPEVRTYFDRVSELMRRNLPVVQLGTGRVRRGCTYAAACNSYFQGLAADGAAQAAWFLAWERYAGDGVLALTECTPLIFEHDAFLCEFLSDLAEEWQWIDRELAHAELRGAANDSGVISLAERREELRLRAQLEPAAAEVERLMVVGMEVYLRDERRPELSVVVGTDPKVSTRWEK